ncbi:hypothetical protein LXL04_010599 [Taraxacum kok-saghyz]
MVSRFPQIQFPFRVIPTDFHLPVHRRHPQLLNMCSLASPNPPPDSSASTKTVKVLVSGRVQGVCFRDWTVENARELGLKGWVRNRSDGRVEALFSGDAETLDEMQRRCRRGPTHAVVTKLDANPSTEDPGTGFERRPTS